MNQDPKFGPPAPFGAIIIMVIFDKVYTSNDRNILDSIALVVAYCVLSHDL